MSSKNSHKASAIAFLKAAASGQIDEAFSKYVAPNFRHHNQNFKGDRASLMTAMRENAAKMPNITFEVKIALEEGDRVATYSRVKTEAMEIAVAHIVRFESNLIVEMWDLGQPVAADSPNTNGMF